MAEGWREGQTPTRRGPWKMLQVAFKAREWYVRIWQDLNLTRLKSRDSRFADRYPPK